MLAPLDNEVIFKTAFTDIDVFTCFVEDILGFKIQVDKIETEKRFYPKVGNIDFAYDIFAESTDHRVIVEMQRVEYDYHFDRFLLYHNMAIAELQRSAKKYNLKKEVYTIVILTSPYDGLDKKGRAIKNEVMVSVADPRDLEDKVVPIYGHKLVFLNPHYRKNQTPQNYRDWLDLFYESTENSENYQVNLANEGIQKVVNLISFDNISPEKNRELKEAEERRIMLSILNKKLSTLSREINQKDAWLKEAMDKRKEVEQENQRMEQENQRMEQENQRMEQENQRMENRIKKMIKNLSSKGNSLEEISEITGMTLEEIKNFLG